ncbi:MAG: hypothetical protein ABI629_02050 [bacterium]
MLCGGFSNAADAAPWRAARTAVFTPTALPATPTPTARPATPLPTAIRLRQAAAAAGNVILVPSEVATLQGAIGQVVDGGIIELAAGTYSAPSGGFAINDLGKAFTIRAASGATVTLDGGGTRDIVRFINSSLGAGRPVTFQNLIFNNGRTNTDGSGAGLSVHRAQATFVGCTFQNNRNDSNTGGGGLVVAVGATAFFDGCLWTNNSARTNGGGLAVGTGAKVVIHRSRFIGNRTNLPNHLATAAGGGIHVSDASIRVSNTRFEGNRAGYAGGGMIVLGSWQDPIGTPHADAIISNCTFIDNRSVRDASVNFSPPTEGGGLHVEDHATATVYNTRFTQNQAGLGGGLSMYRGIAIIERSIFEGNQATATGSGTGFGGAISITSNDANDFTTGNGTINRRSASLTLRDSLIRGRFGPVTTVGQIAGALYVGGDNNRQFGQGGVSQMGTAATNRATAILERVLISDCDVQETSGANGTGNGGGVLTDLGALTMTDSLIIKSDAIGMYSYGGALALLKSAATLNNVTIAGNTANSFGAGIFSYGSDLVINGGRLLSNEISPGTSETSTQSYGAAIYSTPDTTLNLPATGSVNNAIISGNIGLPLVEDDRTNGPINDMRYNGNQIYSTTFGANVFYNPISGLRSVAQLNSLTVARSGAASTVKSQTANSNLGSAPLSGAIIAVPPDLLQGGAVDDATPPNPIYLGYAWSGGAATLNGSGVSGNFGFSAAAGTGTQTLSVAGTPFTDSIGLAADPQASFVAVPTSVSAGGQSTLSWNTTFGTFLDAAIDQGVALTPSAAGSVNVTPDADTTYRFFEILQEGGVAGVAQVSVTGAPPIINSFTASPVLVNSGGAATLAWSVAPGANLTLNNVAVNGPSGSAGVNPTGTTSYTLRATNGFGTSTATATVNVNGGSGSLAAPTITSPSSGQTIGVEGVTFAWNSVAGAAAYDLRLWNAATGALVFNGSLVGAGATSTIISVPSNGSYLFGVRACTPSVGEGFCGKFASRAFTVSLIAPTGAPTVTYPTQGAALTASRQTLTWTSVAPNPALPSEFYDVELTNLTLAQSEVALRTIAPTVQSAAVLRSGNYQLRVRACQAGCGPYSAPVTFSVALGAVPITAPTINTATVSSGNSLSATWTAVSGAEWYQLQVIQPAPAGPGGGALTVASRQAIGSTSLSNIPVPAGQAYVFVSACNGDGCGPLSSSKSIVPAGPNPSAPNVGVPVGGSVIDGPSALFAWTRVPGDTGSNVMYRLYVQDLSRQGTALDVLTTQNYFGALLKAEGGLYAVAVFARPGTAQEVLGPAVTFTVRGNSAVAPTLTAPTHQSSVAAGNIQLGWSPVPGATLYEYFVAVQGESASRGRGVTPGLFVQVPLTAINNQPTAYIAIARDCPAGATCVPGSDAGWGPWSTDAGTGALSFTVTP